MNIMIVMIQIIMEKKTENLFGNVDDDYYYYKRKLQSYFKNNYKYYESKCDKDKKL